MMFSTAQHDKGGTLQKLQQYRLPAAICLLIVVWLTYVVRSTSSARSDQKAHDIVISQVTPKIVSEKGHATLLHGQKYFLPPQTAHKEFVHPRAPPTEPEPVHPPPKVEAKPLPAAAPPKAAEIAPHGLNKDKMALLAERALLKEQAYFLGREHWAMGREEHDMKKERHFLEEEQEALKKGELDRAKKMAGHAKHWMKKEDHMLHRLHHLEHKQKHSDAEIDEVEVDWAEAEKEGVSPIMHHKHMYQRHRHDHLDKKFNQLMKRGQRDAEERRHLKELEDELETELEHDEKQRR